MYSDQSYNLRIQLDTQNCTVSAAEVAKMESGLDSLREPVRNFPVSDLHVTVSYHPRSHDYEVKTSLVLSGRTLFTGDHDAHLYAAFERCVRKLVKKIEAYKQRLENTEAIQKHQKGTHHEVVPGGEPDISTVEQAIEGGDYAAFRRALYVYEESVEGRVGRWIERYPQVKARLGRDFTISDIVEEVFLNAFDLYERRPQALRLGDWLEHHLIDPSVKAFQKRSLDELENIKFARTLNETPPPGQK